MIGIEKSIDRGITGSKPKFLSFFDKLTSILEKSIIKKITGKLHTDITYQKPINDIEVDVEYVEPNKKDEL